MGRQTNEATIAGPSIALLQERFRQLQKVREKREERQLLHLFYSDSNRIDSSRSANHLRQQSNKSTGSDFCYSSDGMNCLLTPPRFDFQDPLSLRLELNTKRSNYRDIRTQPPPASLWFGDAGGGGRGGTVKTPRKLDISDVDTSLHL